MNDKLKFPVLQFYSGLTRLTNESVRNLITRFKRNTRLETQRCFIALLNCIFEAQIHCQSFYEQFLHSSSVFFVLYFFESNGLSVSALLLIFYQNLGEGKIFLDISFCSIDDQCLGMLLGISTEHAETSSTTDVLESVETLLVQYNKYTKTGIAYIARALISNNTLDRLFVGSPSVTDMGLVPLLEALPRLRSLKRLGLYWTLLQPDEILKMIGECVGRSTIEELTLFLFPPSLQSQEAVKEWVQRIVVGGNSLIHSLKSCQVTELKIFVYDQPILLLIDMNDVEAQLRSSLKKSVNFTNSVRRKNSVFTNPLHFYLTLC